jgi:Protein of unknown function (DUF998)
MGHDRAMPSRSRSGHIGRGLAMAELAQPLVGTPERAARKLRRDIGVIELFRSCSSRRRRSVRCIALAWRGRAGAAQARPPHPSPNTARQSRRNGARSFDLARAASRAPGRRPEDESPDRRGAVPQPKDSRDTPAQHLSQGRRVFPSGARALSNAPRATVSNLPVRIAGVCGLVAFVTFNVAWIAGGLAQPSAYSVGNDDISDLGAMTAASPWIYDQVGANLTGILVAVLGLGLWRALSPDVIGRIGAAVLIAEGISTFFDGIFHLAGYARHQPYHQASPERGRASSVMAISLCDVARLNGCPSVS